MYHFLTEHIGCKVTLTLLYGEEVTYLVGDLENVGKSIVIINTINTTVAEDSSGKSYYHTSKYREFILLEKIVAFKTEMGG